MSKLIGIEKQIVNLILDRVLAEGGAIDVHDGEETPLKNSRDKTAIFAAMFSTDEDYLYIRQSPGQKPMGWVRLIYGNGIDLISDYTVNLETLLEPINAEINRFEQSGEQ